jgi:hypothetical protein
VSRRVALAILILVDVAFVAFCLILCVLGTGCRKVSDPVVAVDSTRVRGHSGLACTSRVRSPEPPRLILESHAP